jgi:hypothetical protein
MRAWFLRLCRPPCGKARPYRTRTHTPNSFAAVPPPCGKVFAFSDQPRQLIIPAAPTTSGLLGGAARSRSRAEAVSPHRVDRRFEDLGGDAE